MPKSSSARVKYYDSRLQTLLYNIARLKQTIINYRYGSRLTARGLGTLRTQARYYSHQVQKLHRIMLDNRLNSFDNQEKIMYHTLMHIRYDSEVMKDINHQMREVYRLISDIEWQLIGPSPPGRRRIYNA